MRMRLSLTQSHRTKLCRVGLVVSLSTSHMVRPASVWNCVRGHALKISPGINRKRTVLYPGPVFLSSATLPLLPKKHYNELINQSIIEQNWPVDKIVVCNLTVREFVPFINGQLIY